MTDSLETTITPEAPAAETPEQRIARLEAALAEARKGNLTRPIDVGEAKPKSFDELFAELKAYNEEQALEREENRRFWEEHSAKNPTPYATPDGGLEYRSSPRIAEKPIYGEEADAEALVGRQRWAKFTAMQKAQLRSLRPSDLKKEEALVIFGKDGGVEGMELIKSNPGKYFALKAYARRKNLI
jgi:hypothetical protein